MGKIFYIMGKSASGKDTVYKKILKDCPRLRKVVIYTTRPMRDGEKEGEEYHFTTEEKIKDFDSRGKVIEMRIYQTVSGPWYYATIDDGSIDLGEADYLAIGTLESYEKMLGYYGPGVVEPLYITVDDDIRIERALLRERRQYRPNYAEMCRRYLADEADFAPENLKRCGINNSFENVNLEQCVSRIRAMINC